MSPQGAAVVWVGGKAPAPLMWHMRGFQRERRSPGEGRCILQVLQPHAEQVAPGATRGGYRDAAAALIFRGEF